MLEEWKVIGTYGWRRKGRNRWERVKRVEVGRRQRTEGENEEGGTG